MLIKGVKYRKKRFYELSSAKGATTFSTMTFSTMTLSIMNFSITIN
jgi:hypothetical protein